MGVKKNRCEIGVKKFQVSNGCKKILGVKWVQKCFRCQNDYKNILGVKWD